MTAGFLGVVGRLRAAGCVFAEDEARLLAEAAAGDPVRLEQLVTQRESGTPLEVVVGWAEFCGLRILIDPGVFVPRRRTELMVAQAARLLQPGDVLVDMCCGSGAIGVAVAAQVPALRWYAADLEPGAVACAERNVPAAGGQVCAGDLFDALPPTLRGRIDVVTANAPYVPTAEVALMPPEARLHEPLITLDGGDDGLRVHRRLATQAASWLRPGGALLVEAGRRQVAVARGILTAAGFAVEVIIDDDLAATVVIGRLPEVSG